MKEKIFVLMFLSIFLVSCNNNISKDIVPNDLCIVVHNAVYQNNQFDGEIQISKNRCNFTINNLNNSNFTIIQINDTNNSGVKDLIKNFSVNNKYNTSIIYI